MRKIISGFFLLCIAIVGGHVVYEVIDVQSYYSEIKLIVQEPPIDLEDLVGLNSQQVKYDKTYFYKGDFIGFNAIVNGQYIVVNKMGSVEEDFKVVCLLKKP